MIARVWAGRTRREHAEAYADYLSRTGVKDARGTEGNRGVLVLRRDGEAETEFTFISLWGSLADIVSFSGPDVGRARYYPADHVYLLEMPDRVQHHEVAIDATEAIHAANG